MKKIVLALLLLGVVACSHSHKDSGTTPGGTSAEGEPPVDPTLPSWAPRACADYHAAVVNALACEAIEQGTRDQIKTSYDSANDSWHAMQNAQAEDIEKVKTSCTSEAASVKSAMEGKCVASAPATPPAS